MLFLRLRQSTATAGKIAFQIKSIKSNHFIVTSPQHKCLGEWNSYERAPDSAEKQQTIYYGQTCKKKTNNLHMDRQCKKTALEHLQAPTVQKNNTIYIWTDSAKTTAIYIWTDSAKTTKKNNKNTSNLHWTVHIYRLYRRQCAKYTYIYSVRLVYYKDILNYQRHIIHRMGTSTLCTVSIHNWSIHSNNVRCNRL